jgi:hypothetical protein
MLKVATASGEIAPCLGEIRATDYLGLDHRIEALREAGSTQASMLDIGSVRRSFDGLTGPSAFPIAHGMGRRAVLAAIASWPLVANAQATPPGSGVEPAPPATSPKQSESTREILKEVAARHEELAQLLDTSKYGPAFVSGAQTEFVAPTIGATALLIGYDAVFMQIEGDLGVGFGGDALTNTDTNNTYTFGARILVPVHRGVRADYSVGIGGGASVIDPPQGSTFTIGNALAGARLRAFLGPNVALVGSLGIAVLIRGAHSQVVVGARPLGSAGFEYFFR